jgi:hypothetical protein
LLTDPKVYGAVLQTSNDNEESHGPEEQPFKRSPSERPGQATEAGDDARRDQAGQIDTWAPYDYAE